ncbi:MAG: CehA/McbA family metallohydrolase [Acidobacteriota bacterium]
MSLVAIAAVLSTMHLEGDALPGNGDYIDVPFAVPAGTVEIQIARTYTAGNILDFGVWSPSGYRGWSGGLTDDIIVGIDQSTRGYLPGPIDAGTWTVAIGKAQLSASGAHYAIDITCSDTATLPVLPKAPYSPVVLEQDRRWYKGDFHVHSTQSGDAKASLQDNVDLAQSRGLDFINASDHNTISQQALVAAQQPSWPVLVMRGAEITTYSGHGNGVGISQYVDHRLGHNGRTMANVIDDVAAQGGIFIVNHAAYNLGTNCIGCGWMHPDDVPWDEVSGIEVITSNYQIGVQVDTPPVLQMWDGLEDQGYRIAAVTGSDDHTAGMNEGSTGSPVGSPCTLVLADELSEAAIVDGVRHQHTIAQLRGPDDPFVELTMKGKDGSTAEVGDDVDGISSADMTVHVVGGNGYYVQIWRDGKKIEQKLVTSDDFHATFSDKPDVGGTTRYRAELMDDTNQRVVITSHIYAHGVAGGGGCSTGGGAGAGTLAALALVALRRRRATA